MLMCSSTERFLNSSERAVPHCNVVCKFGRVHCHRGIREKRLKRGTFRLIEVMVGNWCRKVVLVPCTED